MGTNAADRSIVVVVSVLIRNSSHILKHWERIKYVESNDTNLPKYSKYECMWWCLIIVCPHTQAVGTNVADRNKRDGPMQCNFLINRCNCFVHFFWRKVLWSINAFVVRNQQGRKTLTGVSYDVQKYEKKEATIVKN